jgi:hypothetical protein
MAYGYAQQTGDYRQNGILSLLENMASPKGGAGSDKDMTYFMDKDTGTEFDPLKTPTRNPGVTGLATLNAPNLAQHEANHMSTMAGVGIDRNMIEGLSGQELQKRFAAILSGVSPQEQVPVIRDFSRSSDDGKMQLMRMIVDNPALIRSYGIQDEVPVNNLGF